MSVREGRVVRGADRRWWTGPLPATIAGCDSDTLSTCGQQRGARRIDTSSVRALEVSSHTEPTEVRSPPEPEVALLTSQ